MTLSEKLRMLRTEMRMTQLQAAQALGVSKETYIGWECGHTPRYAEDKAKLAIFYNVDVNYLFPGFENELYEYTENDVLSSKQASMAEKAKVKIKTTEPYDARSGETYAEYQRRTNPEYYKSIYIALKKGGFRH